MQFQLEDVNAKPASTVSDLSPGELFVCQDTIYKWWTDSYPDQDSTSYTVKDGGGCAQPSSGKLYTVEKHGFSEPAIIPWPNP